MRQPTEIYQKMVADIPPGSEKKVFSVLLQHIGQANAIRIERLAAAVFGKANSTTIRQTREVIEVLRRDYRVPVMSTSGKPGRWLAESYKEVEATINELENRRDEIGKVINAMRGVRLPEAPELKPNQPKLI